MECPFWPIGYQASKAPITRPLRYWGLLENKRGNLFALVPEGEALAVNVNIDTLPKAAIGYLAASFPKGSNGAVLISK